MTIKFFVTLLLILAAVIPVAAQSWKVSDKSMPRVYFGAFTGAGVNFNLANVEATEELYLPSVMFAPIEFGMLVLEDYGIGINARLHLGSLQIHEDKMEARLKEDPPYHLYDLSYGVSSTGGGYFALQMGVFYSAALSKSQLVDFNALAGAAHASPPSYQIKGWENQRVRYVNGSKWREELQPTFAAGITVRQRKTTGLALAARAEYAYVANKNFMYITIGVLQQKY